LRPKAALGIGKIAPKQHPLTHKSVPIQRPSPNLLTKSAAGTIDAFGLAKDSLSSTSGNPAPQLTHLTRSNPLQASLQGQSASPPPSEMNVNTFSGRLRLLNIRTHELIDLKAFNENGQGDPDAFVVLKYMMRSKAHEKKISISPQLVRLLILISDTYEGKVVQMISGYREPDVGGTSPTSYHTKGMAIDIRIPGVPVRKLWEKVKALGAGGAGLYQRNRFVHIDVRARRYSWIAPDIEEEMAQPQAAVQIPDRVSREVVFTRSY
jgi:uncharacterized protein YcbK (DUF882 family)